MRIDPEATTEEKRALHSMKRDDATAELIANALGDRPPSYDTIKFGHAWEGVRTNGREYRYTCLDALRAITEFADDLRRFAQDVNKAAQKAARLANHAEAVAMKHLKTCPACKGVKGKKIYARPKYPCTSAYDWRDCERCNGAGVVSV